MSPFNFTRVPSPSPTPKSVQFDSVSVCLSFLCLILKFWLTSDSVSGELRPCTPNPCAAILNQALVSDRSTAYPYLRRPGCHIRPPPPQIHITRSSSLTKYMAGGKATCQFCGGAYSTKGISAHEKSCQKKQATAQQDREFEEQMRIHALGKSRKRSTSR